MCLVFFLVGRGGRPAFFCLLRKIIGVKVASYLYRYYLCMVIISLNTKHMDYEDEAALYGWYDDDAGLTDGQLIELAQRENIPFASIDELKKLYS